MLILHIGFHKAGSSTIQTFMRDNAVALGERGVIYPASGLGQRIAHHHLASAVLAGQALPEMAEIAEAARASTVVVSSERFSVCRPQDVRAAFGPAAIVCYRRDLISDPVSRYLQMTKRGQFRGDFDELLETGALDFSPAQTLAPWIEAFGQVRLRSLAEACMVGGELVADFCAAIGVDGDGLPRPGDQNVSPGWMPVELLRAFSKGLVDGGGAPEGVRDFVGRRLRKAVEAAAISCDANARGLYLDAGQIARRSAMEDRDLAELAHSGADIALSPAKPPPPRAFLPEAGRIDRQTLAALLDGARQRLASRPGAAHRR